MSLVLSLFPGIGLLDRAFELEGFCVVRGPDLLWGGDVRTFAPPADKFDGIIGGPPCQEFSPLAAIARARGYRVRPNVIPEFERLIAATRPRWFVMENVRRAPLPTVGGYVVRAYLLNNLWFGGIQHRVRRISFGTRDGLTLPLEADALMPSDQRTALLTRGARRWMDRKSADTTRPRRVCAYETLSIAESLERQGLPPNFFEHSPLTLDGKKRALGNGVPLPLGRAVARAVKQALTGEQDVLSEGIA